MKHQKQLLAVLLMGAACMVQAAPIKSTANNCFWCFMFIFTFQV